MRRALLTALALGLLAVPLLGFRLVQTPEGDALTARPWAPVLVAAGVLACFLLVKVSGKLPDVGDRIGGLLQSLTSPKALAAWGVLAVAVPFLPNGTLKTLAGWDAGGGFHPLGWFTLETLTNLWLYVVLALGLNLVVGQAGVLVLGYGGFYAIGAYTMALLAAGLPVIENDLMSFHGGIPYWGAVGGGIVLGALLAAVAGVLVGFPALRLRGDYLAIVTLGFGEVIVLVLKNWTAVTGGTNGVNITPALLRPLKDTWAYPGARWHYALALAAAGAALLFHARLQRSRLGRAWVAVREDETAARAMGIDAARMKLLAFALAAAWAGLAGALFAARIRFVTPESFTFLESVTILVMVVLGGMGSLRGAVVGAVLVTLLLEGLREAGGYRMLVFGALLAVMMVFRPQGLLPERRSGAGR